MKHFFIIVFLFSAGLLYAQNLTYGYDDAGNRTKRVIPLRSDSQSEASGEAASFEDMLSEYSVKIYPNPTKGQLAVEIINLSSDSGGKIGLYDSTGRLISEQSVRSGRMDFNLSNYASGIYILRITIDGETTTWKVIKE